SSRTLPCSTSDNGFFSSAIGFSRPTATRRITCSDSPNASSDCAIGYGSHLPCPCLAVITRKALCEVSTTNGSPTSVSYPITNHPGCHRPPRPSQNDCPSAPLE